MSRSAVVDARGPDRAVILGGDTNLHIDDGYPEDNTGEVDRVIWERFLAATGLIDVCAELFERTDEIGLLAREIFVEEHRLTLYNSHDHWEHHFLRDPPTADPKLDAQLARLVNRVLDHPEQTDLGVADAWNLAFMCGARSEAARRVAVECLAEPRGGACRREPFEPFVCHSGVTSRLEK